MKPEQAGRTFPCPACHKPVTVPAAAGDATIDSNSADEREERVARPEHGCDGRGDAEQGRDPRPSHPAQGVPPGLSRSPQSPSPSPAQRFVVVDEIGRGGMGAVVRANDCEIRREVAVKYLLDQRDPQKKARFIEEAQITGQLEHPNIVPVHELGLDAEGKLYFTMKMVRGRSLKEVLDEMRVARPEHGRDGVARPEHGRDGRGGDAKPRPSHPAQSVPPDEWSLSRLLGVLVNVCHALAYAHSRGVVHRDLKPANIMVGDFGEVYVMDWGLAKVLPSAARESEQSRGGSAHPIRDAAPSMPSETNAPEQPGFGGHSPPYDSGSGSSAGAVSTDRGADSTALTMDGSILGTPVYMPPEQAAGDIKAIDQRSDVYSLGAILYELLTLQPPVDKSGGHMAVLTRVVQGEIAPPAKRTPARAKSGQIPRELAAVAMKALSLQPADRYQTVEALRRDIELFLEGRSVSAKHDSAWEQARKFIRRNKAVSVATAIAAVVLASVLGASAWINYQERLATAKAYQDYQDQVKKSVPAFVKAARLAAEQRLFEDAMEQVEIALASDSEYAEAWLLKGQLLIVRQEFAAASDALARYAQAEPDDAQANRLLALCRDAQVDDVDRLVSMAAVLNEQGAHRFVDGLLLKHGKDSNEARKFLLSMYQARIDAAWPGQSKRLRIDSSGLHLTLSDSSITDLTPLKGMPLTSLHCSKTNVSDLSPLTGMSLAALNCSLTLVTDLSPLRGMQLTWLSCGFTKIADLAPLAGMPLRTFVCERSQVVDLSPLRGAPLGKLDCSETRVADLSPLQGMPLRELHCGNTDVADLSPLSGVTLTTLSCNKTKVWDLSPLIGMPLRELRCEGSPVADLTPLRGMPLLTTLWCYATPVTDLSPLQEANLTYLSFSPSRATAGIESIRSMKSLAKIAVGYRDFDIFPAAEFWKKYDAGEFHPRRKKP